MASPVEARRVAALYDVHGNIAALDAVLAEVRAAGADLIVFGGDLVWGAWPVRALERCLDPGIDALYVRGNADREVAGYRDAAEAGTWIDEITAWCAARLADSHRSFLMDQAESVVVKVEGLGDVFFCHGSPRSDEERLTSATPEKRFSAAVRETGTDTIVCGHTHMQFDRRAGDKRVVNAGSVGMPYEGRPGAFWALLGPDIEHRRTAYDFQGAAAQMQRSGCPHSADLAEGVVSPPQPSDVIEQFESA